MAGASQALVVLTDFADPAVLAAARQGLQQFGSALCLQAGAAAGSTVGPTAAVAAAPPRLVLGLCCLTNPPGAPKPVLQVRYRPGAFVLRDFHAAVSRLAPSGEGGAPGAAAGCGATAAAALQQLVGVVAQDAACAAAGPNKTVLLLTDRVGYEPSDFFTCLEVCRSKGVQVELMILDAGAAAASSATEALAAAWGAAEAAFPHLSVTLVPGASKLSFAALGSTLLQRYARQPALAVNLQFKQPLLGSIRGLALSCAPEMRPLSQAVSHAALCPCHRSPTSWASGAASAVCSVTGAPLDARLCGRDERTVQVGGTAAGALHLSAPFNIAAVAGTAGGGPANLNVLARVKVEQANPALLFGVPLMLAPASRHSGAAASFKVVHEGEMVDVTTGALLALLCSSLRSSSEALLAVSSTDLESGAAGLLRLHYLLLPCEHGVHSGGGPMLCAKRVACAEELLAPLHLAEGPLGTEPQLPPAVAAAVAEQLAVVPLAERLDPLALSSRCGEVVEMLVRESQPMPRPQPQAGAPGATAPAPEALQPGPPGTHQPPQNGAQQQQQQQPVATMAAAAAAPGGPAPKGRRPAAGGGGRESGARGGSRQAGGGKGGLDLKRTTRR